MKRALAIAAAAGLCMAQEAGEAPPAIAQWGITNYASRIQPGWSGGSIARGSLVRIRGWRLGPAESLAIRAATTGKAWSMAPVSKSDTEIEALVPDDAPLGTAQLHVVRNGQDSLDWPVTIVAASFGAFSRNGNGWGPGEIFNADGSANSEERPAHPGETVRLRGTGLGAEPVHAPQVLVAGSALGSVRAVSRVSGMPGVNELVFDIPADAPAGCYVPVEAVSAHGVYSNAVTLAISRGGPCGAGANGLAENARKPGRSATTVLVHGDLALELSPKFTGAYPMDAVYASFLAALPGEAANPVFLSPPVGSCTPFTGPTRTLFSLAAAIDMFPGTVLDAGQRITVEGPAGSRTALFEPGARHFFELIGGHPLNPAAKALPAFLEPGRDYAITAQGGADVPAFRTSIRVHEPVVWTNRSATSEVDRSRGVTVEWRAAAQDELIAILAMNSDSRSGTMGACVCMERAGAEKFHIPAYALANVPLSPARLSGFPLHLLFLIAFPQPSPAAAPGLARVTALSASVSGRTVRYR